MHDSSAADEKAPIGGVLVWATLIVVLTLLGAVPFFIEGQSAYDVEDATPLIIAGILTTAYAPSLAALAVAAWSRGENGIGALLRQLGSWRVGLGWYALVLVGPFALVLSSVAVYVYLMGGAPPAQWLTPPVSFAFLGPLIAGSLGEELGWRGFAQPRLQRRIGALSASIFIGILWATWHMWPAITPGVASHLTAENLVQSYVRLIATAIIYAWLYNATKSLVLVMTAHAGHNIAIDSIPIPEEGGDIVPLLIAALYALTAIVVMFGTRPQTLTRNAAA